MKSGHYTRHVKPMADRKVLDPRQYLLRPVEIYIVGQDDRALTFMVNELEAALKEHVDTLATIARSPRWVGIKTIEALLAGQCLHAVVQFSVERVEAFFIGEPLYGADDSFIKIKYLDL